MRALLITVGSRGDAEPFCSLADTLASRNHDVDLFLQTDLKYLAPQSSDNNIHIHKLPFTQMDFYQFANPSHGADHFNPRVKFVGVIADCIGELVLPCWEQVLEVANEANVIISSSLARPLAIALAQKLNILLCIVHLQPLVPTAMFPHYSQLDQYVKVIQEIRNNEKNGESSIGKQEYADSYWELEQFQHEFLKEHLDKVYDSLQLPQLSFDEDFRAILCGNDDKILIANAFCTPEVVPHCSDVGPNLYNVGSLADAYVPKKWKPPDELTAFLQKCDAPTVCVGYGSMPFDQATMVVEALKDVDVKVVLVGNALKVTNDAEWAANNVFHINDVPYAWLLPRCSIMLCHGGAGVVNACLRAGCSVAISPFFGDQFSWARLLEKQGLGVQVGSNLTSLSAKDVVNGVTRAIACKHVSRKLGKILRAKKLGAETLVDILESKVPALLIE
mmetsp:Transcript_37050/g.54432  ORF Transcript_37050/g.54432 Transcript_37050/m.54432 type:complete len:447 (-) Transcript_37050:213-1553(-)|eukprot:CAMPEP_0195529072 /NCGR_PEP_ID=MMETSP0794_2-20130614/31490_1 /TAXON_ID=515487 /ORGANISM="Stephanopyxis turris, Strain CCMP 815" /LENGTH=446 /DNA_ID=CAMNT_0040660317 /DNA_START=230 /DNA_END=1570 /DNA_ORIENTATION=-